MLGVAQPNAFGSKRTCVEHADLVVYDPKRTLNGPAELVIAFARRREFSRLCASMRIQVGAECRAGQPVQGLTMTYAPFASVASGVRA